jgi:hypothetical protein
MTILMPEIMIVIGVCLRVFVCVWVRVSRVFVGPPALRCRLKPTASVFQVVNDQGCPELLGVLVKPKVAVPPE